MMWVGVALLIFFILGQINPYGVLTPDRLQDIRANNPARYQELKDQHEQTMQRVGFLENVQTILASNIGSVVTLGIGPIVMASIILQLLSGAELLDIPDAKRQGIQKLLAIAFCFFEGAVYSVSGFIPVEPSGITLLPVPFLSGLFELNTILVMIQIAMGSMILLYLDEIVSKYGIGSGIGLFIVAGVSNSIIFRTINPESGILPTFVNNLINMGAIDFNILMPLLFTVAIFFTVVFFEAMRVEIPLTLGRIRGVGGRYPLKFIYASVLPVIFASALFANIQLFASVLANIGYPLLGQFSQQGQPLAALSLSLDPSQFSIPLAYLVKAPYGVLGTPANIQQYILNPSTAILGFIPLELIHIIVYGGLMAGAATVFGKFWVETTGMGPEAVAEQLQRSGFSVPGFRRDKRVIERVLRRYIPIITILGSATVGLLAAGADITGAIGSGTGILLSVGILYRLYEELASAQMAEMHPMLKGFLGE